MATGTQYDKYGRPVGFKGSESEEGAKYEEIAEREARTAFQKEHGMTGIGKAGQRSKPEWKEKEEAHIADWKKKRSTKDAGRALMK